MYMCTCSHVHVHTNTCTFVMYSTCSHTSTPVKPRAASMFCVILNGTLSGTRRLLPFSKQTL